MNTGTNITRTDVTARPAPHRMPRGFQLHALVRYAFVAELLARGLRHVATDQFRGECSAATLAGLGSPILVRANREHATLEAAVVLAGGELALIDAGHGQLELEVAAPDRPAAAAAVTRLRNLLASEPPVNDRVSIAFWTRGDCGGDVRHREVQAPSFGDIARNYASGVRPALERLLATRDPDRGRLILWRGAPGTGKSHALRALARGWAEWCSAHFIIDPDELLGRSAGYMLDVLSSGADDDRWRLLILEDAGELIASDARATTGQALSRLLNVADGLLGQGTRTLLLITTNEPVKSLHPATRRAGRCLADIEFTPFSVAEANAWLEARGRSERVSAPATLAELFGVTDGEPLKAEPSDVSLGFGFARVLG
jgi:hypothetical protein